MLKNTTSIGIRSLLTLGVGRITLRWKNDEVKMARILQKMYLKQNSTKSKKRFKPQFDFVPRNESVIVDDKPDRRKRVVSNGQQRRARQVGKVLYDYLVQIINTGELDPYLSANNVEITGVKMEPDFSSMNVYWSATGTKKDEEMEEILRKNQGKLKHLLTTYHLVSFIPCINFVKDKSITNVRRVEEILRTIDFGPDFTPTTIPLDIVQYQYNIASPESIKDKFQQVQISFHEKDLLGGSSDTRQNLVSESDDKSMDVNVVKSKNDIYGVQQEEIMKYLIIKKSQEKTRPVINNPDLALVSDISPNLSTGASRQYDQLARKLKKPKVVKAKTILRQMERDYLVEKYNMEKEKEEEYELEIKLGEEEEEEFLNEKWRLLLGKEDDNVHIDENDTYYNRPNK